MGANTIAIPIALTIVGAMLAWVIVSWGKGRWWAKLALILAGTWFGLAIWSPLDSYLGWPTREKLPAKFEIIWVDIREPNDRASDEGAFYLMVRVLKASEERGVLDYKSKPAEPRLYELPYSRGMHQQMEKALKMLGNGEAVVGENVSKADKQNQSPAINGEEDGVDTGTHSGRYKFYKLPPPKLPSKIAK
ncbi:MAG: hypothetical protein A2750_03520 [Candidatus Yanofskybacteria bacterium RIFCSPHIGHO2_01_FULL_45_42]|uniref:Uncharacterized protein n=3 Tax=Candidatus Yanofskyibacteriota TaxID=1752733 RepID=A0A1F8F089_9BACT|nr:MAG: hypothetical protein A2750_03520 [Candidatus Yanofskybacteria bacterium RIFCSPHIGHO2_01_FULL_45_42]OGN16140.1 MAG: hypothetical protein A3C81_01010 [Candidatus Yanofskybacteria bacterium RIFCSPHIGHO2_02_FULL_46_19]OGN26240.1 MAG: hypothetical protein A3B17_02650 [Candidatus Yanofskybacteria bacterium RIFCSPLOWO2_01_FULL_45_72]OGN31794.1 MAG: hypothetical protein A3J01_03325 [Candidatus Yanofskybacteria bacterium RIFCSPLOWO2_02_FULL_45_18]